MSVRAFEDVAFRVIAAGAHPHWTTIHTFRLEYRTALAGLFLQVLELCKRAGLKTVGPGATRKSS